MFLLKENKVEIQPKMLFIPEFKAIWNRDRTKDKKHAKKEFAYIYFVSDYKSEYNIYGIEKEVSVARDIMGNEEYKPDELVQPAIERYKKFQRTYSMRYLIEVRETVDSLMQFYRELRYKSRTQNAVDYDPTPAMKGLKEVETVLEKLEKWEKKVFSEEESMQIRGGGELSMFEDRETATWLKKQST